jgi:hypothetical protein
LFRCCRGFWVDDDAGGGGVMSKLGRYPTMIG